MKHLRSFFAVLLAAAVCAAVVLFSGCGASVQVQQLTIPGERGSIHATLTTPANAENMPAVVICHGFTGNRQLDGHAKPLAKTLAQHGIASIAIDFAGSGESEEPFTAYTPANMRDDITSAITYLTDTVGADPERIGLLGHSMGGRAVSVYLKDSIKATALWAPADNTGLDGLEFLDHSAEGRQAIYDGAIQNGVLDLPKWGVTISADFVQQVADQDPTASLRTYNGKEFRSAVDGDLGLEDEPKPQESESDKECLAFIKETLGDRVDEVKASQKLKSHPVCMTSGDGLTFEMEKYLQPELSMKAKRILEVNVAHPAFLKLESVRATDPELAKKYAEVLYNQALLIAGLPLADPSGYTDLVCSLWS